MVNGDETLDDLLELNHCCQGCDGGAGIGPPWPFSISQADRAALPAAGQTMVELWRYFDDALDAADFAWPLDKVEVELCNGRGLT